MHAREARTVRCVTDPIEKKQLTLGLFFGLGENGSMFRVISPQLNCKLSQQSRSRSGQQENKGST